MPPNPFAPPGADVADVDPSRPPMPPSVRRACRLIIASLALGCVAALMDIRTPRPDGTEIPLLFGLGYFVLIVGLTVWLTFAVARGKGWSRWVMLLFLTPTWWLGATSLNEDFLRSPLVGTISIVGIAIEVAACWMLFTGAGARWFAALAARRGGRSGT